MIVNQPHVEIFFLRISSNFFTAVYAASISVAEQQNEQNA